MKNNRSLEGAEHSSSGMITADQGFIDIKELWGEVERGFAKADEGRPLDAETLADIDELNDRLMRSAELASAAIARRNHLGCTSQQERDIDDEALLAWYRRGMKAARERPEE